MLTPNSLSYRTYQALPQPSFTQYSQPVQRNNVVYGRYGNYRKGGFSFGSKIKIAALVVASFGLIFYACSLFASRRERYQHRAAIRTVRTAAPAAPSRAAREAHPREEWYWQEWPAEEMLINTMSAIAQMPSQRPLDLLAPFVTTTQTRRGVGRQTETAHAQETAPVQETTPVEEAERPAGSPEAPRIDNNGVLPADEWNEFFAAQLPPYTPHDTGPRPEAPPSYEEALKEIRESQARGLR